MLVAIVGLSVALAPTPVLAQVWQASEDYSDLQGYMNWYHMYFDTTDYTYGPLVYGLYQWGEHWHHIDALVFTGVAIFPHGMHPSGRGYEAARVWESPVAGTVRVTGRVSQADGSERNPSYPADGIITSIWRNDELLFSQFVADLDLTGYNYNFDIHVMPADRLIFRSNARSTANYDSTYFDPRIEVLSLDDPSGGSWLSDELARLSSYVAGLDLSLFTGQNDHLRSTRRDTLSRIFLAASNRTSAGNLTAAQRTLGSGWQRLDSDLIWQIPDWMVESEEKTDLFETLKAMYWLLDES
jgi:hypothetical protein